MSEEEQKEKIFEFLDDRCREVAKPMFLTVEAISEVLKEARYSEDFSVQHVDEDWALGLLIRIIEIMGETGLPALNQFYGEKP